jgi:RNA polymerase sigma factor (sigma-70 family)
MENPLHDQVLIDLLEQVSQQNDKALKTLYDLSSSKMYGLAMRIMRNANLAEDVLQEAYLSIWRSAGDYQAKLSPPLAWMGLIVRSRALDMLRRRVREGENNHQELDAAVLDTVSSEEPTPQDLMQVSEQALALHQCLEQLENKQKEVLSLAYLRDLSHSELSTQLQLPLGTVKTWIKRGLEQLRSCMSAFA